VQKYDESGHWKATGYGGWEYKRLGKVMVCFESNYCGLEQFQMHDLAVIVTNSVPRWLKFIRLFDVKVLFHLLGTILENRVQKRLLHLMLTPPSRAQVLVPY
jgi:hypothetical protein